MTALQSVIENLRALANGMIDGAFSQNDVLKPAICRIADTLSALAVPPAPPTGWQPIATLDDCDRDVLLWTPSENLHTKEQREAFPDLPSDLRVSSRRHWTWATHWMPLPPAPLAANGEK